MPGGIINNHDVLGIVKSNEFSGLIQKILEGLGLRMGGFDSKKLTYMRADHSNDIHPKMVAIFGHFRFSAHTAPSVYGYGSLSKPDLSDIYRFILKQAA